MENKVVAHLKDGRIYKGITHDFDPEEAGFHLLPAEGGGIPIRIGIEDMKALFYVKDFLGNKDYVAQRKFDSVGTEQRKVIVTFQDGEVIFGLSRASEDGTRGFYISPADAADNNARIFVVRSSVRTIQFPD